MPVSKRIVLTKNGDPVESISLDETTVPDEPAAGQALIKMLYSPINPSDYMYCQGDYPSQIGGPDFPKCIGFEGVAEVVKANGDNFQAGDKVLVLSQDFSKWQQFGIVPLADLTLLPKQLPAEIASQLIVNPLTAYLMLRQIVELKPGDSFIFNAGNSALGQTMIQLAKAEGFKSIAVIRKRANMDETAQYLKSLGADSVITIEDLAEKGLKNLNTGLPTPKLALECVGGESAQHLAHALDNGGTIAVYGALVNKPVYIGQLELIFRDIKCRGFWLTSCFVNQPQDTKAALGELIKHYLTGALKAPKFRKFKIDDYKDAMAHAVKGFTDEKVLLSF